MNIDELIDIINKGGLLVWPILFCSIAGMTIFFERFLLYRKIIKRLGKNDAYYASISTGDLSSVRTQLSTSMPENGLDKRLILEALNVESTDRATVEMVLIHAVDREVTRLARTLNTLAVFSSVAPLLGLLGTVIGMIKAFSVVESMGGSVNAAVLAGGIWEAMLTTAFGLLAAIPLLFFHNHLDSKLLRIQASLEDVAVSYLKSWAIGHTKFKS